MLWVFKYKLNIKWKVREGARGFCALVLIPWALLCMPSTMFPWNQAFWDFHKSISYCRNPLDMLDNKADTVFACQWFLSWSTRIRSQFDPIFCHVNHLKPNLPFHWQIQHVFNYPWNLPTSLQGVCVFLNPQPKCLACFRSWHPRKWYDIQWCHGISYGRGSLPCCMFN